MKKRDHSAIHTAFEDFIPFDETEPERNLLRAILVTALSDLRSPGLDARKATQFFLSAEEDYVFSFRSICSYLNVDPESILIVAGLNEHLPTRKE